MEWRSRLTEPSVDIVTRRHLQAPRGASSNCVYRTNVAFPRVVTISSHPRSVSCRSASVKVQCLASAHWIKRALSQHGCPSASTLLSSWQQTMTRRAVSDCTLGPLQRHAERLLLVGCRESTKVSYSSKWIRFVNCTLILTSEYGMHPRKPLPSSVSTVLTEVNQMHQDPGFRRPVLGHYVDLLRKGFANVEAQATSSSPVRMSLPHAVVHDILILGLVSSDSETLRQTVCIVLCYCWFNHANTVVLLCRSHVSFDRRGIVINSQGKTITKKSILPSFPDTFSRLRS
jgi:hypothetical protein